MAADPYYVEAFYHVRLNGGRLVLSRCNQCGLVVAASPHESVLYLADAFLLRNGPVVHGPLLVR
jgi:hypothetical protein